MAMKTEEQHNFRVGVRRLYRESIIRLNSTMMVSTTRKKEEERKKRERKREQNRGSGFLAKNGRIKSLAHDSSRRIGAGNSISMGRGVYRKAIVYRRRRRLHRCRGSA